jgi:hypothetical protein
LDTTPLLATMVGKRVLVEWIGVAHPEPEDDEEWAEEWPDNVTYRSHQIGKMGALILVGYNDLGIEVRTGLDDWPYFISWRAVLQIEPLEK